jgi:HD-like signal output (HDOD) protein
MCKRETNMAAIGVETTGPELSRELIVRRIAEISTLPEVAQRVLAVARDPLASAAELKAVMESDAALSARVLRCVNSSAYAVRVRVTNLQQAIAYLGVRQVRNLAMAASVSELFKRNEPIGPYCRLHLWRHLVSVGIGARLIAMRLNLMNFEDVFLAGLLHDIGIVLEDQAIHPQFTQMIASLDEEKTLYDVERSHFGFDHTQLGSDVARLWQFPDGVKAAIRYHHCSAGYRGPELNTVRCVELANLICTLKGTPSVGKKLVRFSRHALSGLGMAKEDIAILAEDFDHEFAINVSLFQM